MKPTEYQPAYRNQSRLEHICCNEAVIRLDNTVMLQYFAREKPLRFCHFTANSSTLRSYFCDCGGGIPIFGQSRLKWVCTFTLLGLLLAGLLLQRTLHTLVRFASCHRSDCSVLAAGACSKLLPNTYLEIAAAVEV